MGCVMGGSDGSRIHKSVECFSIARARWSIFPAMLQRRQGAAVASAKSVYVFGGQDATQYLSSVETFDLATSNWISVSPMRERRGEAVAVSISKRGICIIGGRHGLDVKRSSECFDP